MTSRADPAVYSTEELEETYSNLARLNHGTARVEDLADDAIVPIVYDLFEPDHVRRDTIRMTFEEFTEYMEDLEDAIEQSRDDGRLNRVTDAIFQKGYDAVDERLEDHGADPQDVYEDVKRGSMRALQAAGAVKGGPVVGLGAGYLVSPPLAVVGAFAGLGAGIGAVINAQYRQQGRERRLEEELYADELEALGDHRVQVVDREGKTWSPERYGDGPDDGAGERDWTQEDVEEAIERLQVLEDE